MARLGRFRHVSPTTEMVLLGVEAHIGYEFIDPVLLLEALQFPGSLVELEDNRGNKSLADIGGFAIQLALAATEYRKDRIAGFKGKQLAQS